MTRGNNRNVVFKADTDYSYFLELIARYKTEHPFDLYHYCLMPNHTHFLVKTNHADDFSTFMKKLNLAYFHHYRQNYGWVGHFWQDRFKSQPVGKDEYFIQCGKYIELNPLRVGLVQKPEDFPFSSYNYYAFGKADDLITEDFLFSDLGSNKEARQSAYKELVIDDMLMSSYGKKVWGSNYQQYHEKQKIKYNLTK